MKNSTIKFLLFILILGFNKFQCQETKNPFTEMEKTKMTMSQNLELYAQNEVYLQDNNVFDTPPPPPPNPEGEGGDGFGGPSVPIDIYLPYLFFASIGLIIYFKIRKATN